MEPSSFHHIVSGVVSDQGYISGPNGDKSIFWTGQTLFFWAEKSVLDIHAAIKIILSVSHASTRLIVLRDSLGECPKIVVIQSFQWQLLNRN